MYPTYVNQPLFRGSSFSPLALFAAGEQGAWYDPSDFSTMFQDTAGTTPVTATGQTVGRINDKSGRGNHATQATAASRPIYGIEPFGGRRNLLTFTEQFDNAVWLKGSTTTVSANTSETTDPIGGNTADVLSETAVTNFHFLELQSAITFVATQYTFTAYLKQGTQRYAGIHINDGTARGCSIDLQTGALGTPYGSATASRQVLANGWFRLTVTATVSATASGQVAIYLSNSNSLASYAGNTANKIYIWGAQLETGSTATAYQRVTDQWNVTQAGVPSVAYIQCDGTDDFLVTGTITPGIDKAQVFAGVRKLSDSGVGVLAEMSAVVTNAGTLALYAPSAGNNYGFLLNGSTLTGLNSTTYTAPITNVLSCMFDIAQSVATTEIVPRINGVTPTSAVIGAVNAGAGNFTANPLYIGRRGGTTLPFNGRIYGMAVRFGANLTAAQITQMETWVNGKTGAY